MLFRLIANSESLDENIKKKNIGLEENNRKLQQLTTELQVCVYSTKALLVNAPSLCSFLVVQNLKIGESNIFIAEAFRPTLFKKTHQEEGKRKCEGFYSESAKENAESFCFRRKHALWEFYLWRPLRVGFEHFEFYILPTSGSFTGK